MKKGRTTPDGHAKYELAVTEHIDGSFATVDSNALYQAELRIVPAPGASCIRFASPLTKDKAEAEAARTFLSSLLAPSDP